jgi:hypothetical protein
MLATEVDVAGAAATTPELAVAEDRELSSGVVAAVETAAEDTPFRVSSCAIATLDAAAFLLLLSLAEDATREPRPLDGPLEPAARLASAASRAALRFDSAAAETSRRWFAECHATAAVIPAPMSAITMAAMMAADVSDVRRGTGARTGVGFGGAFLAFAPPPARFSAAGTTGASRVVVTFTGSGKASSDIFRRDPRVA